MTTVVLEFKRPETFAEQVAANINAEVGRRRITQARLARALGMPQSAISDRVRGRTPWTLAEIEAVAGLLDVAIDVLTRYATGDLNPEPAD